MIKARLTQNHGSLISNSFARQVGQPAKALALFQAVVCETRLRLADTVYEFDNCLSLDCLIRPSNSA